MPYMISRYDLFEAIAHSKTHRQVTLELRKRGDRYLHMLITHGARSVLRAAAVAKRCGKPLDSLRSWALALQSRSNYNKATCALANKLARICFATLRDREP
jgi:transposase